MHPGLERRVVKLCGVGDAWRRRAAWGCVAQAGGAADAWRRRAAQKMRGAGGRCGDAVAGSRGGGGEQESRRVGVRRAAGHRSACLRDEKKAAAARQEGAPYSPESCLMMSCPVASCGGRGGRRQGGGNPWSPVTTPVHQGCLHPRPPRLPPSMQYKARATGAARISFQGNRACVAASAPVWQSGSRWRSRQC